MFLSMPPRTQQLATWSEIWTVSISIASILCWILAGRRFVGFSEGRSRGHIERIGAQDASVLHHRMGDLECRDRDACGDHRTIAI